MAGKRKTEGNGSVLDFKAKLWHAADLLRNNMDAAEYKHVVLGLIFLKHISDMFEVRRAEIEGEPFADPEERDEYTANNVFWVPAGSRWEDIQAAAKLPSIGQVVDQAMRGIEQENPSLKGVLPKNYGRQDLDKQRLGDLIDLIGSIDLTPDTSGGRDVLGEVYEYFLGMFASAEGKRGGQFYTPPHVVRLLVAMLAPFKGRVYDPCCGSGGMFVQSERFVEAHNGRLSDVSVFGQESNPTTWRLAKMNLAIRGIDSDLGESAEDTFKNDLHRDIKMDYALANPPFNMSPWGADSLGNDARWAYGTPPSGNANYAWIQHILYHLKPNGVAGIVMANGSMSGGHTEAAIREAMLKAGVVDCMVALPGQLFFNTQIPVCLWFVARNRKNGHGMLGKPMRDRSGEVLFIDARKLGSMVDRTHREMMEEDVAKIADAYHNWRGDGDSVYEDVPGFCKAASLEEVAKNGYVLTPGRYVGADAEEDEDAEPFEQKMTRLVTALREQQAEARRLDEGIARSLEALGYGE